MRKNTFIVSARYAKRERETQREREREDPFTVFLCVNYF